MATNGLRRGTEFLGLTPDQFQRLLAVAQEFPEIMTAKQCAELLQVSTRTVQKMVAENDLPSFRIGGAKTSQLRFRKGRVLDFLEEKYGNAATQRALSAEADDDDEAQAS